MPKEDAAQPEFWEKRFREKFTPWDAGGVPSALEQFLKTEPRGQRVLVPGCGSGYEVRAFAQAGYDVLAIDFAPAAVERARRTLGPLAQLVHLEDFFKFDPGAPRVSDLLGPKGRLAGFFFFEDTERGPPFGLKTGELETLLRGYFDRTADAAVSDSLPIFAGKERWQVWARSTSPSA